MRSKFVALLVCGLMGAWCTTPADALDQTNTPGAPHVSLSLHDALSLALANNLDYQSALADERVAEGKVFQAGPRFAAGSSAGYSYVHSQTAESFDHSQARPAGSRRSSVTSTSINNVNATLSTRSTTAAQMSLCRPGIGEPGRRRNRTSLRSGNDRSAIRPTRTSNSSSRIVRRRRRSGSLGRRRQSQDGERALSGGHVAEGRRLRTEVTLADARVSAIRAHNDAALANAQLANILNINLAASSRPTDMLETTRPPTRSIRSCSLAQVATRDSQLAQRCCGDCRLCGASCARRRAAQPSPSKCKMRLPSRISLTCRNRSSPRLLPSRGTCGMAA